MFVWQRQSGKWANFWEKIPNEDMVEVQVKLTVSFGRQHNVLNVHLMELSCGETSGLGVVIKPTLIYSELVK